MDLEIEFKRFSTPNYFSRINTTHIPEIHIGLDNDGRKSIELREKFIPNKKVKSTISIEVKQYMSTKYNTIRFSLINEESAAVFYRFCEDLIEHTEHIKDLDVSYNIILNRYTLWKKCFIPNKEEFLNENEIMGLLGEMLFIKDKLSAKIGLIDAISSWTGQELTHKDFSYKDTWYEVKSISSSKTSINISSLEQLDSVNDGELIVFSFEKLSKTYTGYTLNKVYNEILSMLPNVSDKDEFIRKVTMQKYIEDPYYDNFVYELKNYAEYVVDDKFPKLTHNNVPDSIGKANYELSLLKIEPFKK